MPTHQEKSHRTASTASAPRTLTPALPSHALPTVQSGTQGGGQALDRRTRAEMSAKFGHDFSKVRIHADHRAGESAKAVGAIAYAMGGDIVFGAGRYNPGSRETNRLLAHELTHVVQQSQFGSGDRSRVSATGDASEREADSLASQVMMGRSVQVQAAPQAAVARIPNLGLGGGPSDNNAPEDWDKTTTGGVGFDHFGWPNSWFFKPSLADGAPPDAAPWNGTQPPSGGTLAPLDPPDPTPGPTVPLPLPGPRVPQPDPPPAFTPSPQLGGGQPYMPKDPWSIDPTVPPWQKQPWEQQILVPPAPAPQPGDFPTPSTDTQDA